MKKSQRDFFVLLIVFATLAIFPFLLLAIRSVNAFYLIYVMTITSYYALLGVSWNLLAGYTGQLSFGHSGLLAVGGYGSVFFVQLTGLPPALGMIVGSVLAGLVGIGLGSICLKLKGIYLSLTTFAFSGAITLILLSEYRITGGKTGLQTEFLLQDPPYVTPLQYFYVSLAIMALCMTTMYWLIHSKYGLFFAAIREDEDAAAVYGLKVTRLKILSFTISSMWAGLAGGYYAHLIGFISPAIADFSIMGLIITTVVMGGMGTFWGPFIGALTAYPLLELIRSYSATLQQIFFAIVVIATLKFARNGLMGLITPFIQWYRKKLGERPVQPYESQDRK